MRWLTVLTIYRLVLPLLFVAAFPGWIVRMLRRGGLGTPLGERIGLYAGDVEHEPCGAVHVHAVSVGEVLLALKLIRAWLDREPGCRFVLATGTATGHAVATAAAIDAVRVVYAPLDFRWMVRCYLGRFEPSRLVLIEGEAWPHLLLGCRRRGIPVRLVNARMSPRSARRYRRFASLLRPLFGILDAVAVQEDEDRGIWLDLGVAADRIYRTGSLKYDPQDGVRPTRRDAFQTMLDACGRGRPVVLAASTHDGEEAWIAEAVRGACAEALPVLVPRHAERRAEVAESLEKAGFVPLLRSMFRLPSDASLPRCALVVDSTGELRDWTAHADAVVIGKSFFAIGGQNPMEAVLAGKPLVFGPHMENFEPLASRLVAAGAARRVADQEALAQALREVLKPECAALMREAAAAVTAAHQGSTQRILDLLGVSGGTAN